MMRRSLLAALAVLAATLAAPSPGAGAAPGDFYVDPAGSDGGAGSAADPWRTLQHAVDAVGPGDTIVVRPGTYAGMRIEVSGAAGAPITLRTEQPGTVVIDRPGPANRHDSNVELETWSGAGTVSWWVIAGIEVTGAPNWGIDVRGSADAHSHHITVVDTVVHHNGLSSVKTGIFFAFTDHVRLVGNESHSNGEHGIYLSNSGDQFVIRSNHLHDNARCGLHMNGDLSQGGDGLISHGRIDRNLITGNGAEGCAGINLDGVTHARLTRNVLLDNHASGIAVFHQDGARCSRRITIRDNTVVQAEDGRWALVVQGCPRVTVVGNVLLTRHPWRGVIEMPSPSPPHFESDHNVVTGRFTVDGGDTVLSLAGWQQATGQDGSSVASSIAATLLPSGRHVPGGPAEDAGAPGGPGRDYDGVRRTAGAGPDAGAFETPYCDGMRATIVGTAGRDVLSGTEGADVVAALGGRDRITLGRGDDTACGGGGRDRISGGPGHDVLVGGRHHDTVDGGPGTDECRSAETTLRCE